MRRFKRRKGIKRQAAYDEKYLWPMFSTFIRLRDTNNNGYGSCFTCGLIRHWKQFDCGHGIPRQHKATKYSEINNRCQCKKCNGFEGGMREKFKEGVDRIYGDGTWEKLEISSKQVCKRDKFEYDVMTDYYLAEVKKLCSQKGIDPMEIQAVKKWVNRKDEAKKL